MHRDIAPQYEMLNPSPAFPKVALGRPSTPKHADATLLPCRSSMTCDATFSGDSTSLAQSVLGSQAHPSDANFPFANFINLKRCDESSCCQSSLSNCQFPKSEAVGELDASRRTTLISGAMQIGGA